MDLNQLSTFVAVAEASSFSTAATKLRLRRSSVSRAIAALENELGVQLFTRTTRRVALTTAGTALYAKIGPHLSAVKEAIGALPEREKDPSGTLRITAAGDIGAMVLADVLAAFSLRYPRVHIELRLTSQNVDLVAEGFDVAFRVMPKRRSDSSLVARKLTDIEMGIFASPTYLARAGTPRSLEDASDHAWVMFPGLNAQQQVADLKRIKPAWTADDVLFVARSVAAGVGLGMVPTFLVRDDVTAGRVVRVLPRVSVPWGGLYLVFAPTPHVPRKVSALREFVVQHFATHPLTSLGAA
ncbi:MAG: LysR family transcriptional regulator [Deltaproteobacteria bacterium]|nr:LysR family transcriptional regulator [Deltaproteobacteria bacterium]